MPLVGVSNLPSVKEKVAKVQKSKRRKDTALSQKKEKSILSDLLVSQVRVELLKLFKLNPGVEYHVRGITRKVGTEINAVRRELANFEKLGLVAKRKLKNKVLYKLTGDGFPYFDEVLGMVVKEAGFGKTLEKKIGGMKFAFISVPFLKGRVPGPEEVDILVVGRVNLPRIGRLVKDEEERIGREINYAVLSERDFGILKKRRDPFILNALLQPKIILTSGAEEYLKVE